MNIANRRPFSATVACGKVLLRRTRRGLVGRRRGVREGIRGLKEGKGAGVFWEVSGCFLAWR